MKKRFVSLMLCLLMLASTAMTASCGSKDDEDLDGTLDLEGESSPAMTLTLWGVKGEGTTDEAVELVEQEISRLTKARFNTNIELNLFFEDEYEEAITARVDEIKARVEAEEEAKAAAKKAAREAKKKGQKVETEAATEETTVAPDETMLDEHGLVVTKYPEVTENQLDIFLITDYDMLVAMDEKGVLSALDEEISGSSKLIKQYVHPTLIDAGMIKGRTVAVLNQQRIGEATYLLLDKAKMADLNEKYGEASYTIENISKLTNLKVEVAKSYLRNAEPYIIKAAAEYAGEEGFEALMGNTAPIAVNYFTLEEDAGKRTLFGNMLNPLIHSYGTEFAPVFMLDQNPVFWNWLQVMKRLEINNCFDAEIEDVVPGDNFAAAIIKGGTMDVAKFEEGYIDHVSKVGLVGDDEIVAYYEGENYYVLQLQAPQGDAADIYNGAFAVSTYTKDLKRSMEIVTYLNTRADIRNLFAYGVEGVHYEINEIDGSLVKLNNDYNMILEYTGNCFIAHAPEGEPTIDVNDIDGDGDTEEAIDYWSDAKLHNLALELTPFFNFKMTEEDISMEHYKHAMEFSDAFYEEWDAITDASQISEVFNKYYYIFFGKGDVAPDMMLQNWVSEAPNYDAEKTEEDTENTPAEGEEEEEDPTNLYSFYLGWFARNIK